MLFIIQNKIAHDLRVRFCSKNEHHHQENKKNQANKKKKIPHKETFMVEYHGVVLNVVREEKPRE